jgi:hypothetical protein
MRDVFTEALNAPSGRLAEIAIGKLNKTGEGGELPKEVQTRLDRLVDAPGRPGLLARVRLAAEVAVLFERAPSWTKRRIVPLFEWSSPEAADAWSSRRYANYIGSPELFGLTKKAFLEMFGRADVPAEDLRIFAEWLTAILIANYSNAASYPLSATEARAALRQAGGDALSSVGHRLAIEMGRAKPTEKVVHWQNVVGPVFQGIWPLDVELQTPASTFQLVHILRETGEAFPEAADVVIPFIRPEDPRSHTSVFSIGEAPEALYKSAPAKMLDLIAAVVGDPAPGSVFSLKTVLARLLAAGPSLANTRKFQKLATYASQH